MPWVGLQCVIVVFPDHTHLLFVAFPHSGVVLVFPGHTIFVCLILDLTRAKYNLRI